MRCLVAGWRRPERESGPLAKPDAEDKTEQRALFKGHELPPATLTWMGEPSEPEDKVLALDKIRRHIRILVDIGRLAGVATDLDRFLDQVVLQVARAVEIDHVKVLRYRPQKADLLVAAGVGWKKGVVRSATLPADLRSPPGRAFRTGEPVTIKSFQDQKEYVLSEFLREHGIISLSNVPVLINGAAWGVLEVDSTTPRDFSEDTIDFLMAAGVLIAAFLQGQGVRPDEAARLAAVTEAQYREVLLREMQHRVKNNFQLILASISIQKRRHSAGDAHRALDHVASRINAISLAHDQLAPRHDGKVVKMSDYVRALCLSIGQQTEGIEIDAEADELELIIDRAVPVGLIINEVTTNSIKHAFGPEGGRISVRLAGGIGYNEGKLTISDNGRGISNPNQNGSGLKLIASLARQIGGSVHQESSDQGTTTSLVFPLIT
jgi:two-component sensor histidine kinase